MSTALDTIITGGRLVQDDQPVDIGIAAGKITAIGFAGSLSGAQTMIDATGKIVIPGAIDIHVHIRAPAFAERGTVQSETAAAAAGGVTTVFEMPITDPCCNSPARLAMRKDHFSSRAMVDFGLFGAPADLSEDGLAALAEAGAIAFKIFTTAAPEGRADEFEGLAYPSEADELMVLEAAAKTGRVVVVHAESEALLAHFRALGTTLDPSLAQTHTAMRPDVCEAVAVARLLTLNIKAQAKLHFAHISSAMSVDILRRFAGTSDFSAETCPHYLFRTVADVQCAGVDAKINPPVRYAIDQEALWSGLADGTITHVATDHAGFSLAEKQAARGNFPDAPPGSPGLEILLPSMLDAALSGRIGLAQVTELVAANAADRFGLGHKGRIAPGKDADLVIFDPDGETRIETDRLLTEAREVCGLYQGLVFKGAILTTLVRGTVVAHNGRIVAQPGVGRFVAPDPITRSPHSGGSS
jgi:dihydroorotase (multifunctional complex type)